MLGVVYGVIQDVDLVVQSGLDRWQDLSFGSAALGDRFVSTRGFGLEQGASIDIHLEFINLEGAVVIHVLKEHQNEEFLSWNRFTMGRVEGGVLSSWCYFPSFMRFQVTKDTRNPITIQAQITETSRYFVVISNCDQLSFEVKGRIEFVNPAGNHLSLEDQNVIKVYGFFWIVDSIALFIWGYTVFRALREHRLVSLQNLLLVAQGSKVLLDMVMFLMYFGMKVYGEVQVGYQ
jgi:hypothetical protein